MLPLILALALGAPPPRPTHDAAGVYDAGADAAYAAAEKLRRAGQFGDAVQAFESIASAYPRSRRAVQALVAAGSIEELQHEAPARAITLYERALAGPADVPGALAALTRRLAVERGLRGAEGELALIHLLVKKRPSAEYTPYLLVRASRLALEDLRDAARALPPVTAASEDPRWVRSSWLDDALHQRAVVERELGDLDAAERTLRKLIARREVSLVVGEYDSDWTDDAYFLLARIADEHRKRPEAAIEAYLTLVEEQPTSRFVDDALHRAAELSRALGDPARARELEQRLAKLRPDSRFVKPTRGTRR